MWNNFELKRVDGIDTAFCKYCLKSYKYDTYNDINTMRYHYNTKHVDIINTSK